MFVLTDYKIVQILHKNVHFKIINIDIIIPLVDYNIFPLKDNLFSRAPMIPCNRCVPLPREGRPVAQSIASYILLLCKVILVFTTITN